MLIEVLIHNNLIIIKNQIIVVETILWGTKKIMRNHHCVRVCTYPYDFKVEHFTENDTYNLQTRKKFKKQRKQNMDFILRNIDYLMLANYFYFDNLRRKKKTKIS